MLLTMPVEGYLEGANGPLPLRVIEWVEVSTKHVKGGIAGRPIEMVDMTDEIVLALRGMPVTWELREGSWSVEGLFDEEPVQLVRILNPFGPTPTRLS